MGLREEKKQATRAAIVDTALALFRAKGFHATRIQDITDHLRISEATFFNYFPTKESVLEAVADGVIDGSIAILDREASDRARPVSERLADLATEFADQLDGDPDFVVLLAGNTRRLPRHPYSALRARDWRCSPSSSPKGNRAARFETTSRPCTSRSCSCQRRSGRSRTGCRPVGRIRRCVSGSGSAQSC